MKKQPAVFLDKIPFPDCSSKCLAIEYFGACECDAICPWKFPSEPPNQEITTDTKPVCPRCERPVGRDYCPNCGEGMRR